MSLRRHAYEERTYDAHAVNAIEPLPRADLAHDELVKAFRPALLHALEAEAQVDGEREALRVVSLENVQPAHDGALVVSRAASEHLARLLVEVQLERVGVPAIADIGLCNPPR